MSPETFLAFIRLAPQVRANPVLQRAKAPSPEAVARCEDFFAQLEVLLPSHYASRRETFNLLTRLRAGRPNLPMEGA